MNIKIKFVNNDSLNCNNKIIINYKNYIITVKFTYVYRTTPMYRILVYIRFFSGPLEIDLRYSTFKYPHIFDPDMFETRLYRISFEVT